MREMANEMSVGSDKNKTRREMRVLECAGDNVVGAGGIIVPAGYDIITVIFMTDFSTQQGFTRLQQD